MQLHDVKRNTKQKTKKRVGRGGLRGKTSGRGHKGQKQHGGHGIRPELRDIIKKLPKKRGHGVNRARTVNPSVVKATPVNVKAIEDIFSAGEEVNPRSLFQKGLIKKSKGRLPKVKILGLGTLSKKVTVSRCSVSESAKEQITKQGGSVS